MLVDPTFSRPDPILAMIAQMNGGSAHPERISQGLYLVGHWNVGDMVEGIKDYWGVPHDQWPDYESYGVCDSPEQVVERYNLADRPEPVFVSFVHIRKADQSPDGGWRWHKWGPYIGTREPTREYLYDEPDIDSIYTFHIYELEGADAD